MKDQWIAPTISKLHITESLEQCVHYDPLLCSLVISILSHQILIPPLLITSPNVSSKSIVFKYIPSHFYTAVTLQYLLTNMFSLTPKLFIFLLVYFLIVSFFTLIFLYSNSHHITPSSSKLCTLLVIMNGRYCFINEYLFFILLVLITVNQKLLMVL